MKKTTFCLLAVIISLDCLSQTQTDLNRDAYNAWKKADDEMAKVYKRVMGYMRSEKSKNLLLEAQRAWIKYKEAHCKSAADIYEGGSMSSMVYYDCLFEVTNERKEKLKWFLEN